MTQLRVLLRPAGGLSSKSSNVQVSMHALVHESIGPGERSVYGHGPGLSMRCDKDCCSKVEGLQTAHGCSPVGCNTCSAKLDVASGRATEHACRAHECTVLYKQPVNRYCADKVQVSPHGNNAHEASRCQLTCMHTLIPVRTFTCSEARHLGGSRWTRKSTYNALNKLPHDAAISPCTVLAPSKRKCFTQVLCKRPCRKIDIAGQQ
jgi:hypothetical protein